MGDRGRHRRMSEPRRRDRCCGHRCAPLTDRLQQLILRVWTVANGVQHEPET
jgi:hypothetical protein